METKKILLLVLIFCVAARIATSYPLNSYNIGGTDTSIHILRSWLFEKYNLVKWNYYAEGGMPMTDFYPPLAYMFAGFAGKFFDIMIAYKLVNNIFFVITPVIFFFLLKEFGLDDKKTAIALLFFSLIPIYPYYFADGRFPSLVGFTFSLLAWLFFKKSLDTKKFAYMFLSALSLSASILSNQVIGFITFQIIFVWLIFHRLNIQTLKKFVFVSLLVLLFTAWWLVPYVLDRLNVSGGTSRLFVAQPNLPEFKYEMLLRIGLLGVYVSDFEVIAVAAFLVITCILGLISLTQIKIKTNREFILLAIAIVAISFFAAFKRIYIFLPIPLSIIAAYGVEKLKGSFKIVAMILLVSTLVASFFMIQPKTILNPTFPQFPTDGRFIFFAN